MDAAGVGWRQGGKRCAADVMGARLCISRNGDWIQAARVDPDGVVTDLAVSRSSPAAQAGDIFLGRVETNVPEGRGQSVSLGDGGDGFLPFSEQGGRPDEGARLCVQVTAAAGRGKPARLQARLMYPGVGLIYVPASGGDGVSRRVADKDTRAALTRRLRAISRPAGGFVARHAADSLSDELLEIEAATLIERAQATEAAANEAPVGARLTPAEPAPVFDLVRDWISGAIRVDVDDGFLMRQLADRFPYLSDRIHFDGPGKGGVGWKDCGADDALVGAADPLVPLPSGGNLIFEPAGALTAVDVNSGTARGGDPSAQTNREAIAVLPLEMRRRNLSGLVVVDMLKGVANEEKEMRRTLRRGIADDPRRVDVGSLTRFQLLELQRERRHPALHEVLDANDLPGSAGNGTPQGD